MKPQPVDAECDAFRATCRRFAEAEIAPFIHDWEEAEYFPDALFAKAAKLGILGAGFPEEYGGSGTDPLLPLVAIEGLMHGGSAGLIAGLVSCGIGLPPILALGSEEQKQRFIPPTLRGEQIFALGITEPGTGSDVNGVRTRAVRDGDHYVLNGSKLFITSGARADHVSVLARTGEGHGGLTFFVVSKGMPGYTVSKSLKKTGWRASDTAELAFDDVRVPVANRIGDEGSGFIALMRNFQNERIALAFFGHATAEIACADAIAYSKQREAFGRPIGRFQVTRHKLAKMLTKTRAARAFNYEVAHALRAGKVDIAAVSMAKNFAAEVAVEVCHDAVQIFGGMGYMRETRVERLSRDARILPIGGGTTEVMNELIARGLNL